MRSFQVEYPAGLPILMNQSPQEFEQEAKMAMAVKLFELGKLTSGQAASMAGIPRADFLLACPKYGVPSVIWDDEEIESEFKTPIR